MHISLVVYSTLTVTARLFDVYNSVSCPHSRLSHSRQGDSLLLIRSDSKGEGFQTSLCRASRSGSAGNAGTGGAAAARRPSGDPAAQGNDDGGDSDDDPDHYYYYRPALPRSISAPLKDLQALKIATPTLFCGVSGWTIWR